MPHFDGHEQDFVEREEHRDLNKHRQAARHGVDLFPFVKRHQLLLLAHLVFLVAVPDLDHIRLDLLHLGHRRIRLIGEREEDEFHKHGEEQDRHAEIAGQIGQEIQRQEERLRQEEEPAPVDRQIKALDAVFVLILLKQFGLLGPGEQARLGLHTRTRRGGLAAQEIIGLIDGIAARGPGAEPRRIGLAAAGRQRRHPVFAGDAMPAAAGLGGEFSVLKPVIADLFQSAVEDAEKAFVQDPEALGLRRAVKLHQAVREQGDRLARAIHHRLGRGDQVILVDLVFDGKAQTLAIVPIKLHRIVRRQRTGRNGRPLRRTVGQLGGRARLSRPSELGVISVFGLFRREQGHDRTVRIRRGLVALQLDIVDARTRERDGALNRRGIDGDPLRRLQRRRARHVEAAADRHGRRAAGIGHGQIAVGSGRRDRRVIGIGLIIMEPVRAGFRLRLIRALGFQPGLFLLQGRTADKGLPQEQDAHGQSDKENEIARIGHGLASGLSQTVLMSRTAKNRPAGARLEARRRAIPTMRSKPHTPGS